MPGSKAFDDGFVQGRKGLYPLPVIGSTSKDIAEYSEGYQKGYSDYEKAITEIVESEEVRSTSETGGDKGVKPAQYDLIPVEALEKVARLYGFGAKKYAAHNWRKGYEWSKSYAALMRHATQFWAGEDIDEETQLPHMAAVVFHAMALIVFMEEFPEYDDRFKKDQSKEIKPKVIDEALVEARAEDLYELDHAREDHVFYKPWKDVLKLSQVSATWLRVINYWRERARTELEREG